MFRPILLVLSFFITFALTACEDRRSAPLTEAQIAERKEARAQRRAANEARRITQGEEIVASCRATQCTTLDLDWKNLSDFTVLNDMRHVKVLMISGTEISDFSDIAGMSGLEELHMRSTNVTSLTGISKFQNLRVLHLSEIASADRSKVASLRGLTELAFVNKDQSLSFLSKLTTLVDLNMNTSGETDISPLGKLDMIERLVIRGWGIKDFAPLLQMDQLKAVTIDDIAPEVSKQLSENDVDVSIIPVLVVC
ncbi:MAG: leucine-rich repeat domain-containing protein [Planktomarina sp.]